MNNPNEQQFKALPSDTQCACSRTSLSLGEFITLGVRWHQVCSSDFVTNRWFKAIFSGLNTSSFRIEDFRRHGSAQFQALAALCRLSKMIVQKGTMSIKTSTLLSPQVLSEIALQSETEALINQYQMTIKNTLEFQLEIVRQMTMSNQLFSGLETNAVPIYMIYSNGRRAVSMSFNTYSYYSIRCECRSNVNCIMPASFTAPFGYIGLNDFTPTILWTIPGFNVGCMPIDSILASTLQCFYDQTCVNQLISFFPTREVFTAMNVTRNSSFNQYSTVKTLADQLMLEEWVLTNLSYEKYYIQCAPSSCLYTRMDRYTMIFVLSKIVGLLSILTLVLAFIIPNLVTFIKNLGKPRLSPRISCKSN